MSEEVTKEDRAAAWPHRPSCYKDDINTNVNWRDGIYDRLDVIQAFARHRLAERERCAKVAEDTINAMRGSGESDLRCARHRVVTAIREPLPHA